jgi:hypothetical protein
LARHCWQIRECLIPPIEKGGLGGNGTYLSILHLWNEFLAGLLAWLG